MRPQSFIAGRRSVVARLSAALAAGLLWLGLSSLPAAAQSLLCQPGAVVYYVNGIRTSLSDAAVDLVVLRNLVALSQNVAGRPISYEFTHNPDDGDINDFRETLLQWISQDNPNRNNVQQSIERLRAAAEDGRLVALLAVLQNAPDPRIRISSTVAAALRAFIANEMPRLLAAHSRANAIAGAVSNSMNTFIDRGNMVVLVTHSQGNFVGNAAYDLIPAHKKQYVSIVSVATPANRVTSNTGVYFTLARDVIRHVPGALAANTAQSADCPEDSALNHSFAYCYAWPWAGTNVSGSIKSAITQRVNQPPPPGIIANGVIVGTLRWGSQPDVDLHAFEPSNFHVYYSARTGPTARLDLDDVTSFGPENIFVCDNPAIGTYRFGVNYYRGTGPETANIEISAGGVRRQMPAVVLPASRGSSGNASPVPTGSVVVSRDAQNRIIYRIQ